MMAMRRRSAGRRATWMLASAGVVRPRLRAPRDSPAATGTTSWPSTSPPATASRPGTSRATGPSASSPASRVTSPAAVAATRPPSTAPSRRAEARGGTRRSRATSGCRRVGTAASATAATPTAAATTTGPEHLRPELEVDSWCQPAGGGDPGRRSADDGAEQHAHDDQGAELAEQHGQGAPGPQAAQPGEGHLGPPRLGRRGADEAEDDDRQQRDLGGQQGDDLAGLGALVVGAGHHVGQLRAHRGADPRGGGRQPVRCRREGGGVVDRRPAASGGRSA